MSVYDKNGNALLTIYDKSGNALSKAYDKYGVEIFSGGSSEDYDEYDTEYQHSILTARNAWANAYRADDEIIPLVLTTDQHGYLSDMIAAKPHGRALYSYLSKAVNWSEASANLNLGDVCGATYKADVLSAMQTTLAPIPMEKQINLAGNHDVQGITDDNSAMDTMFDTYFNNSAYNGNVRYQHRGFETMIDADRGIRYICIGSWDYTSGAPYYRFNISGASLEWLIDMLETVDNYDIVILSHIQPSAGTFNSIYPSVDGNAHRVVIDEHIGTSSAAYNTPLHEVLRARKNKISGTITDSAGVTHSYDFSACTSDLLCSLHGHSHVDWYNYFGGIPTVIFDSYRYDACPFYFINIDKNSSKIDVWKIGEDEQIQKYTVPFVEHVNPCTGISLNQSEVTVSVGDTVQLEPSFTTQYPDDGTYPEWRAIWKSSATSVATVSGGLVTGVSEGTSIVKAFCGDLQASCTVTVVT